MSILSERQIPFEERPLFANYGGFGSSVHVVLPSSASESEMQETLVLGIPLSGHTGNPPGELPFGVKLGIAFIEHIRSRGSAIPIRVAFLGDERSSLPPDQRSLSHAGLQDLTAAVDTPENTLLVYLDMDEAPQSLVIHHGDGKRIATLNVLESLTKACDSQDIPYTLTVNFNELYKLDLVTGPSVLRAALDRDLHALYLGGSSPEEPRIRGSLKSDTDAALSEKTLVAVLAEYADTLRLVTGNLDYHYLIIQCLGNFFFISEPLTMLILMLLIGAFFLTFLVYSIVYRTRLLLHWCIFIRYCWIPLIFLGFLVIALEAAGFVISWTAKYYQLPPSLADYGRAGFKLVLALLFLSVLFPLVDFFTIPEKAQFYGNAAIILVSLGLCITAGLNITFIPVFIWVLLFACLGAVIRIPILVYLCALITPLQALGRLASLLRFAEGPLPFGSGRLAELFLAENHGTSLYLAIITLPFMLMLERGTVLFWSRRQKTKRPPLRIRLIPSLGLICGALAALGVYTQRLAATLPPAPVRRILMDEQPPAILRITSTTIPFLERQTLHITLAARGNPQRFGLYLEQETGTLPVIYAAPMPFELNHEQNSITFILGEGPPNPFTTELVLPRDFSGSLRAEALYGTWDPAIDTLPAPASDDYVLRVLQRLRYAPPLGKH
jgi:hypothetical protein